MKQLKLNYQIEDINSIINNIKDSNITKELIENLNITDEEIITHYDLLSSYQLSNQKCQNCRSMKDCKQSTIGMKYCIKRDDQNILTDYFSICRYYKDYYTRKKNIVYTTFNEEDLLDDSQKNFFYDNVNYVGNEFISKVLSLIKNEKVNGAFVQLNNSKLRLRLMQSLSYKLLLNHQVSIIKFSDFLKTVKSEFKVTDGTSSLQEVINSEILIIDGIGNESITSWSRDEILLSILDNRIQMEKTTFICSEYSLDQLKKLYKLSYNDEAKANQVVEKINELKR